MAQSLLLLGYSLDDSMPLMVSFVAGGPEEDSPVMPVTVPINSIDEAKLCRGVKEKGSSIGYMVDNDGNYQLNYPPDLTDSAFEWQDANGDERKHKILLTYCSRGQGKLFLQDTDPVDGSLFKRSKGYTFGYSRLAVQIDDAPGGKVAAQLLVSVISSILFWAATGPVIDGGRSSGSSMQPFAGLTGMVLGAMVLPLFGFGDWIFAIILITIAVLFGFLYASLISGKT